MEIKIASMTVDENQVKAIIEFTEDLKRLGSPGHRDSFMNLVYSAREKIVEHVVDQYMKNNLNELMKKVDDHAILNLVSLNIARRVNG